MTDPLRKIPIDAGILTAGFTTLDDLMSATKNLGLADELKRRVLDLYGEISVALIKSGLAVHRKDGWVVLTDGAERRTLGDILDKTPVALPEEDDGA